MQDDPAWYRALHLTERVARRSEGAPQPNSHRAGEAARRISKWKSQSPFNEETFFEKRLGLANLSEQELLELLSESDESLRTSYEAPRWLSILTAAYSCETRSVSTQLPPPPQESPFLAFLPILEPLISQALGKVQQGAQGILKHNSTSPFSSSTAAEILYPLLSLRLGAIMGRAAVLQLHVARLEERLIGNTPEDRFRSFIDEMSHPDAALLFLKEYPVLARMLVETAELWVSMSLEFLRRLDADWDLLVSTFASDKDPGPLQAISGGLGDRHRGGRAVLIACFRSGLQVVYKPKSLNVDRHFQELLTWLNHLGAPGLTIPKVLDRHGYGWSEFVAFQPCKESSDISRFYQRQGAFLALLYALEATDFHNENLIAAGEHPMLVDLESLFKTDFREDSTDSSDDLAIAAMGNSVLRVGLLPQPYRGKGDESFDASGLGGEEGQISPWEIPTWEDDRTDSMRVVRKKMKFLGGSNRPRLGETDVDLFEYEAELVEGFKSMYMLLLHHREKLLAEDGPLAIFRDDEVRFILRHTRLYAIILYESYHPDYLRDALDRERLFDRLWLGFDKSTNPEEMIRLLPWEREDLWRNDIPFFSTRVASRSLWTSSGVELKSLFPRSGLDAVCAKIKALSEKDLRQQIWIIRSSFAAKALETESRWTRYPPARTKIQSDRHQILTAACAIGDRLAELAIRNSGEASWIGLTIVRARHWTLAPLWKDLYGGLPGLVLFLAYLGAITGDAKYTRLAEEAFSSLQRQVRSRLSLKSLGAFEGWGGLIYCWLHLSVLWGRDNLLSEAEDMVLNAATLIEIDEGVDIIGGSAGCLAVVLGLHHINGSPETLGIAQQMGEHLLRKAIPFRDGLGWPTQMSPKQPLTGFSHGAAGIAWALLKLGETLDSPKFFKAAEAGIRFEDSFLSFSEENWPDLRGQSETEPKHRFMTAWCHGASGIGLSRLRMLDVLDTAEIKRDVNFALRTTIRDGFGSNHSLCHGDLGNIELLLEASRLLGDPLWKSELGRIINLVLTSISEHGWRCGVPLGVETPGLLAGLAGIGYGLLRLIDPDSVPSVLILDPPRA